MNERADQAWPRRTALVEARVTRGPQLKPAWIGP